MIPHEKEEKCCCDFVKLSEKRNKITKRLEVRGKIVHISQQLYNLLSSLCKFNHRIIFSRNLHMRRCIIMGL